jgi:hypothetical protein
MKISLHYLLRQNDEQEVSSPEHEKIKIFNKVFIFAFDELQSEFWNSWLGMNVLHAKPTDKNGLTRRRSPAHVRPRSSSIDTLCTPGLLPSVNAPCFVFKNSCNVDSIEYVHAKKFKNCELSKIRYVDHC